MIGLWIVSLKNTENSREQRITWLVALDDEDAVEIAVERAGTLGPYGVDDMRRLSDWLAREPIDLRILEYAMTCEMMRLFTLRGATPMVIQPEGLVM